MDLAKFSLLVICQSFVWQKIHGICHSEQVLLKFMSLSRFLPGVSNICQLVCPPYPWETTKTAAIHIEHMQRDPRMTNGKTSYIVVSAILHMWLFSTQICTFCKTDFIFQQLIQYILQTNRFLIDIFELFYFSCHLQDQEHFFIWMNFKSIILNFASIAVITWLECYLC